VEGFCALPCDMNIVFAVLGNQQQSSLNLYLDAISVAEFPNGSHALIDIEEICADDNVPVLRITT
jgi:hypothetical protein